MTLDEAIAHAREVAERNRKQYKNCPSDRTDIRHQTCEECAEEHEQLATWLEELKMYKSLAPRELVSEKQKNDRAIEYNKGFDYGFKTGYNKAIDDFSNGISEYLGVENATKYGNKNAEQQRISYDTLMKYEIADAIDDIAEQLKVGVTND